MTVGVAEERTFEGLCPQVYRHCLLCDWLVSPLCLFPHLINAWLLARMQAWLLDGDNEDLASACSSLVFSKPLFLFDCLVKPPPFYACNLVTSLHYSLAICTVSPYVVT